MTCMKCGSEERIKFGKIGGAQRYKCRGCGYQYTRETGRGKPLKVRLTAVLLYLHGLSMNAIAKLVGVSTPAVLKWIREFAEKHCDMPQAGTSVIVELDEMWHYVKKNTTSSGSGKHWIMILDNLSTGNAETVIGLR